jgi:hypothetical protein
MFDKTVLPLGEMEYIRFAPSFRIFTKPASDSNFRCCETAGWDTLALFGSSQAQISFFPIS